MRKKLTDPQTRLLIGEIIPPHRHHQDSYDDTTDEDKNEEEDEDEDETVGNA